jgi:chromate transporter
MNPDAAVDRLEAGGPLPRPSFSGLVLLFLKLGAIGFGGGMAVVALLEDELVQRRRVMDHEEFLHGIALGQLLGPFAVNTSLFVGYRLFGLLGGLACAAAFLLPSVSLVVVLSWVYFRFHTIPALQAALVGLGPVVIALIVNASWSMGRKAVRSWPAGVLAALALVLALGKVPSPVILLIGGTTGWWAGRESLQGLRQSPEPAPGPPARPMPGLAPLGLAGALPGLTGLGWTFLKAGLLFFGGGFVLVPVLHEKLVVSLGWLTTREFLDGVAISNLTPGPIAVLATFAGYKVQGVAGALLATLALFTPATLLMLILAHSYGRLKAMRRVQDVLAGLAPTVVGLVLSAAALLAPGALHGFPAVILALMAWILLLRIRCHPAIVISLGALAGLLHLV